MAQDHSGVLLEDINDTLSQILEATSALKDVPSDIRQLKDDVHDLKSDMKIVKAAVTDTSREQKHHGVKLGNHEGRITHLERST
jgi:hypothetical protein